MGLAGVLGGPQGSLAPTTRRHRTFCPAVAALPTAPRQHTRQCASGLCATHLQYGPQSQTAPREAEPTSRAYLCSTPRR